MAKGDSFGTYLRVTKALENERLRGLEVAMLRVLANLAEKKTDRPVSSIQLQRWTAMSSADLEKVLRLAVEQSHVRPHGAGDEVCITPTGLQIAAGPGRTL